MGLGKEVPEKYEDAWDKHAEWQRMSYKRDIGAPDKSGVGNTRNASVRGLPMPSFAGAPSSSTKLTVSSLSLHLGVFFFYEAETAQQ